MAQTCWKKSWHNLWLRPAGKSKRNPTWKVYYTIFSLSALFLIFSLKFLLAFWVMDWKKRRAYVLIAVCFSSWKLVAVIGITFYAYKLTEHVIGAPINLPDYINNHPAIATLTVQPNTKRPYNDRLCFFRCRACHFKFRRDRLERPALQLVQT